MNARDTWESKAKGVFCTMRTVRNSVAKCVVRLEDGIAGMEGQNVDEEEFSNANHF